jgi:iron complex transport system ATP-binding protein
MVRGGRSILERVNFRGQSGEFVAVIGANGAGKSTLLAVLAGLLAPDSGTVSLDGRSMANLSRAEIARARAYLPQNPRCEWPIAVERLIALGLTPALPAFGGLPAKMQARVDDMLGAWDLVSHRGQAATTISGGELARAMLARASVGDPDILIADEPISGLDPRHALDTVARLRASALGGKLVIAAVHDLTMAARYATRIVALERGRVAADGPPRDILTPELIRKVFDVEARISGSGDNAFVDYLAPLQVSTSAAGRVE